MTFFYRRKRYGKINAAGSIAVGYGFYPEAVEKLQLFFQETHSNLNRFITVVKGVRRPKDGFFLRAESFYNVASEVDRLDREGAPLIHSMGKIPS